MKHFLLFGFLFSCFCTSLSSQIVIRQGFGWGGNELSAIDVENVRPDDIALSTGLFNLNLSIKTKIKEVFALGLETGFAAMSRGRIDMEYTKDGTSYQLLGQYDSNFAYFLLEPEYYLFKKRNVYLTAGAGFSVGNNFEFVSGRLNRGTNVNTPSTNLAGLDLETVIGNMFSFGIGTQAKINQSAHTQTLIDVQIKYINQTSLNTYSVFPQFKNQAVLVRLGLQFQID